MRNGQVSSTLEATVRRLVSENTGRPSEIFYLLVLAMAAVRVCSSVLPPLSSSCDLPRPSRSPSPGTTISPLVRSFGKDCQVCRAVWRGDSFRHRDSCKPRLPHVLSMNASYYTSAPSEGDVEGEFSLTKKKCVPCSSEELRPMTEEAARTLLAQIPEWALLERDGKFQLQRSWKSKNFVKGLEFFKCIADIAESEGHHPDLHLVGWNNVTVNIFTHAIGGLTENDFILAAKIDALDCKQLLRRSLPKSPPAGA